MLPRSRVKQARRYGSILVGAVLLGMVLLVSDTPPPSRAGIWGRFGLGGLAGFIALGAVGVLRPRSRPRPVSRRHLPLYILLGLALVYSFDDSPTATAWALGACTGVAMLVMLWPQRFVPEDEWRE